MLTLFTLTFLLISLGILDDTQEQPHDNTNQTQQEEENKQCLVSSKVVIINKCTTKARIKKSKINSKEIEELKFHLNQYVFPGKTDTPSLRIKYSLYSLNDEVLINKSL
ncbi:hypothetical protein ABK040_000444 [Willaertia magna]